MGQTVENDGVPAVFGIELRPAALFQKELRLLQGGREADAQADQPIAGGIAPSRENLVEIDFAHPGPAGQGGFGNALLDQQTAQ